MTPTEKWCNLCRRFRPAGDFHRNRARKDGLSPYCAQHMTALVCAMRSLSYSEAVALFRRDQIADPDELERIDREERDREERLLAGQVEAIEQRRRDVAALKRLVRGEALLDGELDAVAGPIPCARTRARRAVS